MIKELILAKINELRFNSKHVDEFEQGYNNALNCIEYFINNSLPVEQPSEDLKEAATKEACKRYRNCPALNIGGDYEPPECYNEDRELFVEAALWGGQWQKKLDMGLLKTLYSDCDNLKKDLDKVTTGNLSHCIGNIKFSITGMQVFIKQKMED